MSLPNSKDTANLLIQVTIEATFPNSQPHDLGGYNGQDFHFIGVYFCDLAKSGAKNKWLILNSQFPQ